LIKIYCSEAAEMKVRYGADRRPAVQRLRSVTTGKYRAVQFDNFASGHLPHAQKDTQLTYNQEMIATFVELPPFARTRKDYMDDDA
jgi:hypothetical protein